MSSTSGNVEDGSSTSIDVIVSTTDVNRVGTITFYAEGETKTITITQFNYDIVDITNFQLFAEEHPY